MLKKIVVSAFIWIHISFLTVVLFFIMLFVSGLTFFFDKKAQIFAFSMLLVVGHSPSHKSVLESRCQRT